jgi:hypothetical protein
MSKSKGGFTTLQSLIDAGVHPLAYRLMCLQAHYRSELEFSAENLAAALTRLKRLVITVPRSRRAPTATGTAPAPYLERLDEAVSDDLNTPKALPVLDEMLAEKKLSPADRLAALAAFDAVLGPRPADPDPRRPARPPGAADAHPERSRPPRRAQASARGEGLRPLRRDPRRTCRRRRRGDGRRSARLGLEAGALRTPRARPWARGSISR